MRAREGETAESRVGAFSLHPWEMGLGGGIWMPPYFGGLSWDSAGADFFSIGSYFLSRGSSRALLEFALMVSSLTPERQRPRLKSNLPCPAPAPKAKLQASATSSATSLFSLHLLLTWSSSKQQHNTAERSRELGKGAPATIPAAAMRLSVVLLFVALLCLGAGGGRVAASTDFNFPAVFNFGDSNSDTGGRVAAGFESILPPYGSTFFGGPAGRFCDGRLILDFLMEALDMPLLNAYLDSLGTPSFRTGVNFAQAGCSITPAKPTSVSPFSFGLQVKQFFAFKDKVTKLLSKGDLYGRYIPLENYFSEGLYMFDIGQNDLAGEFYSKTEDQVIASIPTILLEFETGLKKLYDQGARKFWIHNTGPLGCLPQNIALFGKDPSQLDELHCVAKHNRAAKLFNLQLHALCTKLRGEFAGASITYVDIHTIKYNLIANYSRFGFEHATQACCGYGGPPLNYDGRVPCGQTVSLNGKSVTANGCSDTTEFVNWDGIHYTEAANFHITSHILTGKYSDPPFVEKMPFVIKPRF